MRNNIQYAVYRIQTSLIKHGFFTIALDDSSVEIRLALFRQGIRNMANYLNVPACLPSRGAQQFLHQTCLEVEVGLKCAKFQILIFS